MDSLTPARNEASASVSSGVSERRSRGQVLNLDRAIEANTNVKNQGLPTQGYRI